MANAPGSAGPVAVSSTQAGVRFAACFDAHYAEVLAFALRRVANRAMAEDVAAETFAIAWRRFDAVPDDELPWLYGVARRVIANQNRSGRRQQRLLDRLRREPGDGRRDPAEAVTERQAVLDAFATLGDRDQEVLRLTAWEGLDARRGGMVLGCSKGAFAVRLHRARRRLAKELTSFGHVPDAVTETPISETARDEPA